MANDEHTTPETTAEQLAGAREQERLHRALQQQGGDHPSGESVPPRERERHEAIDHAVEDVERSIREAAERRSTSGRPSPTKKKS